MAPSPTPLPILPHTLRHPRKLFRRRFALMRGFPLGIGHAVHQRPPVVLPHAASLRHPIAEAVAAEACVAHQVDILDVGAVAQVSDQAAEGGCRYGIFDLYIRHEFVYPAC